MDKKTHKTNPFFLVKLSVAQDFKFFTRNKWPIKAKYEFVAKKYFLLPLHLLRLKKFELGSSKINFNGRDIYYNSVFGLGAYQWLLASHQQFLSLCKFDNPTTFIDVGANMGYFTILLAENFPTAQVLSFEPVPATYDCFVKNSHTFKNVVPFNMALSNYKGEAYMFANQEDSGLSHLSESSTGTKVRVDTLDNVVEQQDIEKIDLLKIDVETFEKEVLCGASKALAKTHYLLIEASMLDNPRYTFSELVSLLISDRYNFQLVSVWNFLDKADGPIPGGDFLFKNVMKVED